MTGAKNCVKKVKRILSDYGVSHVFDNQGNTNYSIVINVFKQRVIYCFQQGWSGPVNESPILTFYKEFKVSFEYEHYLDLLPSHLKCLISRLRLSIVPLRMQTGRYARNRIPRNERYCLFCDTSGIDDEPCMCISLCLSVTSST